MKINFKEVYLTLKEDDGAYEFKAVPKTIESGTEVYFIYRTDLGHDGYIGHVYKLENMIDFINEQMRW